MSKANFIIGCKLPAGIILHLKDKPNVTRKLNGVNQSRILGGTYGITEVDAEFWAEWVKDNKAFKPYATGAIFVAASYAELESKARDLEKVRTGFEPMLQTAMGVKQAEKA